MSHKKAMIDRNDAIGIDCDKRQSINTQYYMHLEIDTNNV
jgi:hypothetical protein